MAIDPKETLEKLKKKRGEPPKRRPVTVYIDRARFDELRGILEKEKISASAYMDDLILSAIIGLKAPKAQIPTDILTGLSSWEKPEWDKLRAFLEARFGFSFASSSKGKKSAP